MAKGENFTIERFQTIQGVLDANLKLDARSGLTGRRQAAQKSGGQRNRACLSPDTTQMDIAAGIAQMRSQVLSVESHELDEGDVTDPLEEGNLGIAQVPRHRPGDLEVGLLEHVGRIHTAMKPAVEPQSHEPMQPVPMFHEVALDGSHIARAARQCAFRRRCGFLIGL